VLGVVIVSFGFHFVELINENYDQLVHDTKIVAMTGQSLHRRPEPIGSRIDIGLIVDVWSRPVQGDQTTQLLKRPACTVDNVSDRARRDRPDLSLDPPVI